MRGPGLGALLALRPLPAYELVKVALLPAGRGVLHQQRKIILVELLQPIVPIHRLQRIGSAESRKIQPQHADSAALSRALHTGRGGPALFGPLTDLVVIGQHATSVPAGRPASRRAS